MLKDYYGKDASALLEKKLYLLDMDGTIYLGDRLFPGVNELLEKMESRGGGMCLSRITPRNRRRIT